MKIRFCITIFVICLLASCSRKWVYTFNPIVVKHKGKESIIYPAIADTLSSLHTGIFVHDLCIIFENSTRNTRVQIYDIDKEEHIFFFQQDSIAKNNVMRVVYLPNDRSDMNLYLNRSSIKIERYKYYKYSFLVVKKRKNGKFYLTFTNYVNYNFDYEKMKTSEFNYPYYKKYYGNR